MYFLLYIRNMVQNISCKRNNAIKEAILVYIDTRSEKFSVYKFE